MADLPDDFVSPERPPSVASNSSMVLRSQCRFTRSGLPCPVRTNNYAKGRRASRRSTANSFQSNSSSVMAENGFMRINETEFSDDDFTYHNHSHSHGHSHHHHHNHDFDDESVITPSITDSDVARLREFEDDEENDEEVIKSKNHIHHILHRVRRKGNPNRQETTAKTTRNENTNTTSANETVPVKWKIPHYFNRKYLPLLLIPLIFLIGIYSYPAILCRSWWPSLLFTSPHPKQFDPSTSENLASHQLYMQSLGALSDEFQQVTKAINEHIISVKNKLEDSFDQRLQLLMTEHERLAQLIQAKLNEPCCTRSSIDEIYVKKIVDDAIAKYDSDKTALPDYALESSGGTVVNVRCSETYRPQTSEYRIMGITVWRTSNSPRTVIQPGSSPGECWAFHGSQGHLVIKLARKIIPTSFTYEHAPKTILPEGAIETSPKDFRVYGLQNETDTKGEILGEYVYDMEGKPLQNFPVANPYETPYEYIELRVLTNNGNPNYTCLYRFRVHGKVAFN